MAKSHKRTKKSKAPSSATKRIGHFSFWHIVRLFIVYTAFYFFIFILVDFLAFEVFNPILFTLFAAIGGALTAGVHVHQGNKTEVDEIADEI